MKRSHPLLLATVFIFATAVIAGCSKDNAPSATGAMVAAEPSVIRDVGDDFERLPGGEPFADSEIFFEFNSTDNDLGVQVFLDGEDWNRVKIYDPNGQTIVDIQAKQAFRELGLTELRFESAEPSPQEVLDLFDPGVYEFQGRTTEGDRLTGMGMLSDVLPAAPVFSPSSGEVVDPNNTVISWNAVAGVSHYQVIVSNENTGASMEIDLPASVTSVQVPPEFMTPNSDYKAEVLSISPNGNKTITEGLFSTSS